MKLGDFKPGLEFRYRNQSWRCTDVGSRTAIAICLTEVWTTRVSSNTGKKERVRITTIDSKRLEGPPYGVPEHVFDERTFQGCVPLSEWNAARRLLGIP